VFIPDYDNSIVNLTISITAAMGAASCDDYAPLPEVSPTSLTDRSVVLLIADGLGAIQLDRYPESTLAKLRVSNICSVLPTTTASAITTFFLAAPTQQHAITGWFTYLKELDSVTAILPFSPRGSEASLTDGGYEPAQFIGGQPLSTRIDVPTVILSPYYIVDSPYSLALAPNAERHGHRSLEDFVAQLTALVQRPQRQLIIAYWTDIDALAHEFGVESEQSVQHFGEFDRAIEQLIAAIPAERTTLLLTADHGLVDTAPERTVHLDDHPALASYLRQPLSGEPRFAYCHVREHRHQAFTDYLFKHLRQQIDVWRSSDLLDSGFFGRGTPDPRLRDRIGDFILIPRAGWIVKDRLRTERPFAHVGVHGGLSEGELLVPLCRYPR
jgi:hypothetical protein